MPMAFLNSVYLTGQFFRKMLSNNSDLESSKMTQILKKYASKFVVNLVIIITILSVMDYFSPEIVLLLEDPNVPFFMEPTVFVSIITILLLAYPIFSLVGRLEKVVNAVSDSITINLGVQDNKKPVHRIIRNILFVGLILLLVAIFITFTIEIENIPNMPVIISTIGLLVSIPLIMDTIITVQNITHSNVVALLRTGQDDDNKLNS